MLKKITLLIILNLIIACGDKSSSNKNNDSTSPTKKTGEQVPNGERLQTGDVVDDDKNPPKPDVIKDPEPTPGEPPIEEDGDEVYTGFPAGERVYDLCKKQNESLDAKLTYKLLSKYLKETDCLALSNAFISKQSFILDFNFLDYYERKDLEKSYFDLSIFSKFPTLNSLVISNVRVANPESLDAANSINFLSLQNNHIKEIDFIANLESLLTLSLDKNQIKDLSPLKGLEYLTTLSADENEIVDVEPLSHISILTSVSLNNNLIEDLSPLEKLFNLQSIEVGENKIKTCPTNAASVALMKLCRSL